MTASVAAAAPDRGESVAHDTLVVTVGTLVSRLTGFGRVLVTAAVLSNGVLGDTYHTANTIPNLLFELIAAGVLQAILIPSYVAARREGGDDQLGESTGAITGVVLVALGVVSAVFVLAAPLIGWLLTLAGDQALQHDKRVLMTRMLMVFVPQVLFYGLGMVTSAALAARRRFAAAALAPAVNNIIVIVCLLAYRSTPHGAPPSMHLDSWQFIWVVGGTTLGVIAFTAVPGVVLSRQGVRWRPRWAPHHPAVRSLRRSVGWATLSIVGTLVPTAAALVLGYRVEGGVAMFTMTFAFFVLPHALVAVPVATALAPRVADAWQQGNRVYTGELIDRAARTIVPVLLLAGAGLVALSWPIARVASFGQAAIFGTAPIAHALAAFGVGLVGYGMSFTMLRLLFSLGDIRGASLLVAATAVVGAGLMAVLAASMSDHERATALALGYGITQTLVAALLTWRSRAVTGYPTRRSVGRLGVGSVVAAVAAGAVMWAGQALLPPTRLGSLLAIVVCGVVGVGVFLAVVGTLAGVSVTALVKRGDIAGSVARVDVPFDSHDGSTT